MYLTDKNKALTRQIFNDCPRPYSLLIPTSHRLIAAKYLANKRKLHARARNAAMHYPRAHNLAAPRKTVHLTLFNHQSTTRKYEF
jgi:hypothetical protein